ncbi:phosphatidate cytidylyltransferase [Gemelliphila palaticanis]|uniref:Phosphatidate cytidylyltransferase n=1 Tax=Gemelliphila palaticanis TaxID=81950 RepID=A0ABX2SY75_9BACL|nr:phosphatidate cytidylyltransferase [Gemella palaticanis]MBF0715230.1 phosphatidate cytidylyltransferase [Gemella palaticanis]NYS47160.1 phosphatidate cytidylyltransferase [Gemella palaticanis]
MKTRIITGALALIAFLPFLILGNKYFLFASILLSMLSVYEVIKITLKEINLFAFLSAIIIVPLIFFRDGIFEKYTNLFIFISVSILFSIVILTSHRIRLNDVAVLYFLFVYVINGFYSLFLLRDISISMVLYLLVTIWVTDSGAYFGGMKFGKNKLSPNISPNKSIEGSVIGSLSSIFVAIIFYYSTNIFNNLLIAILITILVSIVGQIGDLIESAYKREYSVKDSSNILPGHGGIFDRFDSVILAAPFLIILLQLI